MSQVSGFYTSVDDSLGKAVMIEATKRANQAEHRLSQFKNWTWTDYERFVTWMAWQDDIQSRFFAIGREAQKKGAIAPSQVVISRGPPLDISLRMAVSASFRVVDHAGGISGLGSMIAEPDEGMRSFAIFNPSILTANYQRQGNIGRVNGELDSGKTQGTCVIFEQWLREDQTHIAISNIRMFEPVERYIYTTKASQLLRVVCGVDPEVIWLFGMDEGGLNYSKPDQITKHVRQLDKLMRIIRKMHGSFILIEQREEAVPNLIMDWARNIYTFQKGKGHVVSIELRGPELAFRDTVKAFPKTKLPYDTDDPAAFDFDIDMDKVLEAIASDPDNPKIAILGYLDSLAQDREEIPRPCQYPGCTNSFTSNLKHRKYCDDHRQFHIQTKSNRPPKLEPEPPKSLPDFLL